MNKTLITFFTIIFCMTSSIVWSADLQKGFAAALKGDFVTALREWTPIAEQGDAGAQYNLGQLYYLGDGVTQNYKTALKWYRLSAEQGISAAQYQLGHMYYLGDGVTQNSKTAVKWYRLSAEQGLAVAQRQLGLMYGIGNGGVIKDNIYAHMWINISALNGYKNADKLREYIAKKMTSADISTAQRLARECVEKKYKGC